MGAWEQNAIDTYEDFLAYWSVAKSNGVDEQIRLWETSYMAKYPELLAKQIANYEDDGLNWRQVAHERVFPHLAERLQLMREARENILVTYKPVSARAYEIFELDFDTVIVVYVGIGCGAGWATRYGGSPAILLGLENIAESAWHTKDKLEALLAHEIGHLAHMTWRNQWEHFERAEKHPLFELYSEGFAQRCEHIILGRESWHQAQNEAWLGWCQDNRRWLAEEFLQRLDGYLSVRDFFASWMDIKGKKETGYFLGHEFIRYLETTYTMREIASLDNELIEEFAVRFLMEESGEVTQ